MSFVLHMSDFHFGKDVELEKKRLTDLAAWITKNNICIDYLIFTGDMIDAPTVQMICVEKLKNYDQEKFDCLEVTADCDAVLSYVCDAGTDYISFYNTQLREVTLDHMKRAGEIFLDFINRIGLDKRRVILCCGNHDRIRFAGEAEFSCSGGQRIDEDEMTAPFEAYDVLCSIVNDKLSHRTMVYSHGGMNFVIANSSWKMPKQKETNQMCVSCESLSHQLSQLRQSDSFSRNHNWLIAHKPSDDFCETIKFPYAEESITVSQIIERTTVAFLYGDKHSYSVKMNNWLKEFMCGLPLSHQNVRYNLLDFDSDTGVRSCSYVLNEGGEWMNIPITDCQKAIYDASKPYLKSYAFTLLAGSKSVPLEWDYAIELMQSAYEKGTLEKLSQLFLSFSELRQGCKTIENYSPMLFEHLKLLIDQGPLQSVGVKGRPGVGKSTFMTIMYLYMFMLFSTGKTRFIPLYFDLEAITSNPEEVIHCSCDVDEYISCSFDQFLDYFSNCYELAEKYKLPLCLFIDGLEKSKILAPGNNTIEKRIYQLVETKMHQNEDRYVMCFNTHDSYSFDDSFEKINRFEYVLFMNGVRILPYKSIERKRDAFLASYLALKERQADEPTLSTIKKNLTKFRTPSIDLFFLHHCDKHIFEIEDEEEIWEVLKSHLIDLENIADRMFHFRIATVQQAAGILFSQRKCYAEIIESFNTEAEKPTIVEFLALVNAPIITNYLIANQYVQELITYSNSSNARIPKNSILFSFVHHELSILIRLILDEKGNAANSILARFINRHGEELSGYLYSTIAYLCGHLRTDDNISLINSLPSPIKGQNEFFSLCHHRSYALAYASCSTKRFPAESILLEIFDSEAYRKFNRSYQRHYYQDASINSNCNQLPWSTEMPHQKGFDFRNSFLMLLSKLEQALWSAKSNYPLMQLDLFTLCDLIYSRLQYMNPNGFFYFAKYNEQSDSECEAVLDRTIALLDRYNTLYGGKKSTNERIGAYFSLMQSRLIKVKRGVEENKGKNVTIPYVSPCYDFTQILQLSYLPRVGWDIGVPGVINENQEPKYSTDSRTGISAASMKESLMQHVMESVYIAQMFLPDDILQEGFQKSKVISYLLLSELGKTSNGDYSPFYSNYNERGGIEETELAHMSILGALDGYAVQPAFMKPLSSRTAMDINMRICWEIKMIQREFKYYTLYNQLDFTDKRRAEFEADFEEPVTNICKSIREQLVFRNPDFKVFFNN